MVDDEQPLEIAFNQFIRLFPYTRYQRFPDQLRYDVMHLAFAESTQREAKKLIAEHKLPLATELVKGAIDAVLIIKPKT